VACDLSERRLLINDAGTLEQVRLSGFDFDLGDAGGDVRVGQNLVQAFVPANEGGLVGGFGTHGCPSLLLVSIG